LGGTEEKNALQKTNKTKIQEEVNGVTRDGHLVTKKKKKSCKTRAPDCRTPNGERRNSSKDLRKKEKKKSRGPPIERGFQGEKKVTNCSKNNNSWGRIELIEEIYGRGGGWRKKGGGGDDIGGVVNTRGGGAYMSPFFDMVKRANWGKKRGGTQEDGKGKLEM